MTGTIEIHRVPEGWDDRYRAYSVRLDGHAVATIKRGETVAIPVDDGRYDLHLAIAWCRSPHVPAVVAEGQLARFTCRPGEGTAMWKITIGRNRYIDLERTWAPGEYERLAMPGMTLTDIIALLERALRAEVDLDQVAELWPHLPADPYLLEVRDDLEFALEHVPQTKTRPWRADLEQWERMPEYDDLQMHIARLRTLRDQN
jgi:hypothetical protein